VTMVPTHLIRDPGMHQVSFCIREEHLT
jgi:hypothetical protein